MSKTQEIKVKEDIKVFNDKKTNARTIALPFRLPDESNAVVMICRLKNEDWKPEKIIKSVTIKYI